jgi:hypothetical protein
VDPPTLDTDMDGTPDCQDGCPFDKNKTAPGVCSCGVPDNASRDDGGIDCTSCDPVACAGQTLLPAYDCNVCCTPSDAGSTDAGTAPD